MLSQTEHFDKSIILRFFILAAVLPQIFIPIAELVIPIGILIKEAKAQMQTHPVIVDAKIRKFSI